MVYLFHILALKNSISAELKLVWLKYEEGRRLEKKRETAEALEQKKLMLPQLVMTGAKEM